MMWLRVVILTALFLTGCASQSPTGTRSFAFPEDSFAYANELVWVYEFNPATGEQTHRRADPAPQYSHHCFVVAKAARQFFNHAEFRPELPKLDSEDYARVIREVFSRNPRNVSEQKVKIPGYGHLREFSEVYEEELKKRSGGAWQSYFQRGHWRMILPFSRNHQAGMASNFEEALERNHPPVAHIVTFPELAINHAVLVIGSKKTREGIEFEVYDPNQPEQPTTLSFIENERSFYFPRNFYFKGGKVDVYEHYKGILY